MIDVGRLRAETPGTDTVIHLNNAGASLMPAPVVDTVLDYLAHEARFGGYETRAMLADRIEDTYEALGDLLAVPATSVSLADNATRAWDMAFYGMDLRDGDRILTTTSEYASNLAAYHDLRRRRGVVVDVVPDAESGEVDVEAMAGMIDPSVKLITLNHMPTSGGLVNPAAEVGAVAKAHDVPFLLDACQTVGQIPIDVRAIGCDMLSATSRKYLRGPRGVGFLHVSPAFAERLHPPLVELESGTVYPDHVDLHTDRRRFETWEKNYSAVTGLGVAVRYALDIGVDAMWARIVELAAYARERLDDIEFVTVRDVGSTKGGIVTLDLADRDPSKVRDALRSDGINVSVSTRFSSPIDMERRGLDELLRISVHAYNTTDEIDRLVEALIRYRGRDAS